MSREIHPRRDEKKERGAWSLGSSLPARRAPRKRSINARFPGPEVKRGATFAVRVLDFRSISIRARIARY
jgi:hypothetical protein